MTLYYSLVFLVMVIEMAVFLLLVAPLPDALHRRLIRFFRSPLMTRVMLSVKFTFVFILVLFVDSVQRVLRVEEQFDTTNSTLAVADRSDFMARKFYAQRNVYLCGSTLFLSLILNRVYSLVKANSDLRQQLGTTGDKNDFSLKAQDYKERLERKKKQFKQLEEQNASLQKEYDQVCDELNTVKGIQHKTQTAQTKKDI